MADVTITGLRVAPVAGVRIPTTWRAFCVTPGGFQTAAGTSVSQSSPYDNGSPYKTGALSSSGPYYSAGDFTLPATTDSPDKPNEARWGLFIFDQSDRLMYEVAGLAAFWLDHTDTTQTPEDIIEHNLGSLPALNNHNVDISGNLHVGGNASASSFTGSAAGLHDFPGGASLVNNAIVATGSAGINADSDGNGVGEAYLSINSVVKLRARQDGLAVEPTVPVKVPGYATGSLPAGEEKFLAYDTTRKQPAYHDGAAWQVLARDVSEVVKVKQRGLKGDGLTDDTPALQTLLDNIESSGTSNETLLCEQGTYIIGGALQDTSNSNSQIKLPIVTASQLSLRLLGTVPPSMMNEVAGPPGVTLKSTLGAGNGAVIGGKASSGTGRTKLSLFLENVTIETVPNPTLTALDLRYVSRLRTKHAKVWTGETGTPTEPSHSGSYGLRTPNNNLVSDCGLEDVVIGGFYNGMERNELDHCDNVTIVLNKKGMVCPAAFHSSTDGRILMVDNGINIEITGDCYLDIQMLDIEHHADVGQWYSTTVDINDPGNHGFGRIPYHVVDSNVGVSNNLTVVGGLNLDLQHRPGPVGPVTLATGANNNIALPPGKQYFYCTGPSGAYSVSGFTPQNNGHLKTVYFNVAQTLTLKHDSTSSTGNRLALPGNADIVCPANKTVRMQMLYDKAVGGGAGYWVVISVAPLT